MKHWAAFASILLLVGGALVWSEMRKVEAPVGPEPILNLVADTERELTRLPVAFSPLADAEEIKIGKELEKMYAGLGRAPGEEAQNRSIESYLQQIGSGVAAHAHRKLPYSFHYIPSLDFINAFALPGGPVFFGEGLLGLIETEDELAVVLGHEIEHIDHYHCAERIQVQANLRNFPLGGLISLPVEIFVAGYSKSQELEADREGTKLAVAASYSPQGAIEMFEAFERVHPSKTARAGTPQEEVSDIARQTLEGYFRSHPLNAERIDQIRKLVASRELPAWNRTKPFPLRYVFITERAWRSLQSALARPYPFLAERERRKREQDRVKRYEEAVKLASQSLDLKPDQPRALQILGVAKFGLGDYAAAAATYRELLPNHPTFADGIRQYADQQAAWALEAKQYALAATLAAHSLELQPNQADALKILAKSQFWLSDFKGSAETTRKLHNMYPDAADEIRIFASDLADWNFGRRHYAEAAGLAAQSLELKPDEPRPQTILAKSQFALADFPAAAAAYRRLLDQDASDLGSVSGYADALASSRPPQQAAKEFENWLTHVKPATPALSTQMGIELAGLRLMAGDEGPAKTVGAQALQPDLNAVAPEFMRRLGWWYYRAGNYPAAIVLLRQAIGQRPGSLTLQAVLAWNELEQNQLEDAVHHFTAAAADSEWSSPVMGRAIARWRVRQTEEALRDFDAAVGNFPQWLNAQWVKALYPPSVVQSVAAMQAELQRRKVSEAAR